MHASPPKGVQEGAKMRTAMKVLAAFTSLSAERNSECHVALVGELWTIHLAFENLSASSFASLSLNSWSYALVAPVLFSPCKLSARGACQEWSFSLGIWQKASELRWSLQLKRRVAMASQPSKVRWFADTDKAFLGFWTDRPWGHQFPWQCPGHLWSRKFGFGLSWQGDCVLRRLSCLCQLRLCKILSNMSVAFIGICKNQIKTRGRYSKNEVGPDASSLRSQHRFRHGKQVASCLNCVKIEFVSLTVRTTMALAAAFSSCILHSSSDNFLIHFPLPPLRKPRLAWARMVIRAIMPVSSVHLPSFAPHSK